MLEITDPQGAAGSMIHIPSWAALEGSINAYEVMDGVLIRDLCREPPPFGHGGGKKVFVPRSQIKNRGFPIVVAAELFRSQIKSVVLVQIHPTDCPIVFPFHFEPVSTGFGYDESRHGEKHEVVVLRNADPGVSELAIPYQ